MSAIETRKKILNAMYTLIAEQGYERASIGRIAEIVEVKKAAIYYYYKKKEDILFDLIDNYMAEYSFDYTFYETANYEQYKSYLLNYGLKNIHDYRHNIALRKITTEINLLAQRNEEVHKKVENYDKRFEDTIEKFFKHGINIKVLDDTFDVRLNTDMSVLIFSGIANAITFNHDTDIEKAWIGFVDRII